MSLHRRSFANLLLAVGAGCTTGGDDPPTETTRASESATATPDLVCSHAAVADVTIRPEPYQEGTATLFEDYVDVVVDVRGPRPPPLVVRLDTAGGPKRYERAVDGTVDREGFTFGPFGHHGVSDVTTWFAGCRGSTTATTADG